MLLLSRSQHAAAAVALAHTRTCVRLHIQVLQQLQRVTPTVLLQPVCQHAAASVSHTRIPVLQQLLQDAGTLLDAAGEARHAAGTAHTGVRFDRSFGAITTALQYLPVTHYRPAYWQRLRTAAA